jgi:hypothetical protein
LGAPLRGGGEATSHCFVGPEGASPAQEGERGLSMPWIVDFKGGSVRDGLAGDVGWEIHDGDLVGAEWPVHGHAWQAK